MHEAVDNVLDHIHVFAESFHDAAVGSHIEECVYWSIYDASENVSVYTLHSFVYQDLDKPLFCDLTTSLEEYDCEHFDYMSPEFLFVFLQGFIFCPFANHVV
jgi:hypothetical protein